MKKIWKKIEEVPNINQKIEIIQEKYKLGKLVSRIIANKNIDEKDIEKFLNPTRHDFYDPFLMPDMEKAINRILKAIEKNEKIIVYGDYDVDGITSSTIIKRFMKDIGIEVDVYIPNRINEGYGLNKDAITKIANEGYNLIITVDCGITAIEEIELAKELKIEVIVTDHHEPGEEIPETVAVVDCKRKDNKYPFRELAGCGVAFKLIQALAIKMEINENEYLKYLDIACIGTISDIVPLIDENRVIAKLGLMLVKQTKNIGLREILKLAGFREINATTVSFGISPRINACGRMGHQEVALELFLTNDPLKARELAEQLEEYNIERQNIEKRIFEEAIECIESSKNVKEEPACYILGKEGWHHGVIGIVSSKITESYYKPSILICFEGEDARGSGRSIEGFDIHEAVSKCNKYLTNYGGHSMAIGLSLKTDDFDKFKKEFEEYAKNNIQEEKTIPELKIDDEVNQNEVNIAAIKELSLLEPFGEANYEPVFIYKNLKITSIRTLTDGKHLKLGLQDIHSYIDAIGFGMGELAEEFQIGDKIDIVGKLQINSYNNTESIQVLLKDLRKAVL